MTLAQAQSAASTLRECLLDNGVRAVSIELQPGVAGSGWYAGTFKRGMGHHIASRPSQGLTPGLATVKNGRGGANPLTGPLANCYGGWDYTARIITLGWANHPGAGGPWVVPGWGTVPRDNGRPYILGWEFEGGYEPYTDEMHAFMACCGAGTLDYLGTLPGNPGPAPLECFGEHKDPWAPGRKIDRLGYTAASGRARIAAVRGNPASPMPFGGETMSVAIAVAPNQTCWIDDGNKVWWTNDIKEVEALGKLWNVPAVPMADAQIQKCIDFRWRRKAEDRAADVAAIRQAMPEPNFTPEQIKAISEEIFEQIAPRLDDAQPLSKEDFQAMLDSSEIDTVRLMASGFAAAAS